MLGKIMMFGVIIAIIYFFIVPKFTRKNLNNSEIGENFVECDKCKTFVSINQTTTKNGKIVCKECLNDDHR